MAVCLNGLGDINKVGTISRLVRADSQKNAQQRLPAGCREMFVIASIVRYFAASPCFVLGLSAGFVSCGLLPPV
jgi:hypothetical protein